MGIHLFIYFQWSKDSELNVCRGVWGKAQTGNGGWEEAESVLAETIQS